MAKKKKSNKVLYILIGIVIALFVIVIVGKQAGFIGKKKQLEVEVAKATHQTIVEKVSASGDIQPEIEVKLSPDVSGEIIDLRVEEGDSVIEGSLLVKIKPDNLINAKERVEAALNQQKANLASAKASLSRAEASFIRATQDYNRQEGLHAEKVISDSDWEVAQQNYDISKNDKKSAEQSVIAAQYVVKSSEASLKEARENVRLTSVLAPMSGIVSKLIVEQGERVVGTQQMTGTEMLRIADLNKMEVRVAVNENDIIRVALGDTALIDVDSYSHLEKEFKGIVTEIANTANDKASADAITEFEVKIRILNSSYADLKNDENRFPFRPGMTASVEIITKRKNNVLTVPLSAVTTRNPELEKEKAKKREKGNKEEENDKKSDDKKKGEEVEVIFVASEGKAKMIQVKTGISDYENIEILSGVDTSDVLISGPFLAVSKRLKEGDEVKFEEKSKEKDESDDKDNESEEE
ncbi:MAG: efflux RND transporter periplasmic adaptor subunit [Cyclobacteriaceae bacterium]|nr:efflux RND transporter periplasmic adaptor subunit [Cyclobacteriaceae bacterium]